MRVVYKQVTGSKTFNYALLLGGGLSGVNGLTEGEGGYFGDMLSLYDAGGLSASAFRDHLAVNGIGMDTQVALTYTSIHGQAPSSKLPTLMKALLALANGRTLNRGEFDIYLRNERWAQEPVGNRLYSMLYPGFTYSARKYAKGLNPGTQAKAAQFYESLFSRMNDGMLLIVGDVDEATVRRALLRYLGGFRTQRGTTPRKTLRYQPRPGVASHKEAGVDKGVYMLLDAEIPLSGSFANSLFSSRRAYRFSRAVRASTTGASLLRSCIRLLYSSMSAVVCGSERRASVCSSFSLNCGSLSVITGSAPQVLFCSGQLFQVSGC